MTKNDKENMGYVYILTNPCFTKNWVKIGFTDNVERRVYELSQATGVPLPFETYAVLKTAKYKQAESMIHKLIGKLAPDKRINPKREFFNIEPDDAVEIFTEVANILDDAELSYGETVPQATLAAKNNGNTANNLQGKRPKTFDGMGIRSGEKIEFVWAPEYTAEVVGSRKVLYDGKEWLTYPLMVELGRKIGRDEFPASGFEAFRLRGSEETLFARWYRIEKEKKK